MMAKVHSIIKLDVSENDFGDDGMTSFLSGLYYNGTLKTVILDRSFEKKTKDRPLAIKG